MIPTIEINISRQTVPAYASPQAVQIPSVCGDQADGPCLCRHQNSYQISVSVDEVLDTQGNGEWEGQQSDFGWDGKVMKSERSGRHHGKQS